MKYIYSYIWHLWDHIWRSMYSISFLTEVSFDNRITFVLTFLVYYRKKAFWKYWGGGEEEKGRKEFLPGMYQCLIMLFLVFNNLCAVVQPIWLNTGHHKELNYTKEDTGHLFTYPSSHLIIQHASIPSGHYLSSTQFVK